MSATSWTFIVALVAFALVGRLLLAIGGRARVAMLAALSLGATYAIFYRPLQPFAWWLAVYVAYVTLCYVLLRLLWQRPGVLGWVPFFAPLLLLVVTKYTNALWTPLWSLLHVPPQWQNMAVFFVGISYVAFRLSYLVIEVRTARVEVPRLDEYLAFAFFVPLLVMGPITSYASFSDSLRRPTPIPVGRALERIVVGATKYLFLGALLNMMAFDGLLYPSLPRTRLSIAVAMVSYYLFLYCNFSGFCDMVIGACGLMNLRVDENFDRPFIARNLKDFWNRWHMTLSTYMRDVVFTPLSKALVRRLGPRSVNHAVAISVAVVFLLVGVWHGVGWHYFIFGLLHAIGVVAAHYYGIALKRFLGPQRLRRYLRSRMVHALAIAATFGYAALCQTVFAREDWFDLMRGLVTGG